MRPARILRSGAEGGPIRTVAPWAPPHGAPTSDSRPPAPLGAHHEESVPLPRSVRARPVSEPGASTPSMRELPPRLAPRVTAEEAAVRRHHGELIRPARRQRAHHQVEALRRGRQHLEGVFGPRHASQQGVARAEDAVDQVIGPGPEWIDVTICRKSSRTSSTAARSPKSWRNRLPRGVSTTAATSAWSGSASPVPGPRPTPRA
jgi:hypothetical protein